MSTITTILEPDSEGCLHLPVPEELRGGKVKVIASLEPAGSDPSPAPHREPSAPGAAAQVGNLRPVSEDAARRVDAVRRLQASMKERGVDFEEWKRTVREGRR